MTPADYRSNKMSSLEGDGIARRRWEQFLDEELDDIASQVVPELEELRPYPTPLEELDSDVREEIAEWAKRRSDLMGFWLSWHLAGGFRQLQSAGWHRATIFRKVREFRETFGEHPDRARFDWITVDFRKLWRQQVASSFHEPNPDFDPDDL